ncbi:GNAT family N-acetyltransferase [Virgibacillus byunsanensis]|uniref:GNAT family N-acetyltransferase n=1 Tax=Virgibacillus byunsanensis TaxID=570945 RepID=A0ABW3LNL0_9BACI
MNIRRAILSDAEGIAKVHVDSWISTYKNIVPDSFLDQLSYKQRASLWERNIAKEGNYVFIAISDDGEIVGFADCGKRDSNSVENSGDLTSIYLLQEHHGKGIGKLLMKQLFLQFKELGLHRVFVEVLEDNKTCYFYEYYGANLHKSETITIASAELKLLIYEWDNLNQVLNKFD